MLNAVSGIMQCIIALIYSNYDYGLIILNDTLITVDSLRYSTRDVVVVILIFCN